MKPGHRAQARPPAYRDAAPADPSGSATRSPMYDHDSILLSRPSAAPAPDPGRPRPRPHPPMPRDPDYETPNDEASGRSAAPAVGSVIAWPTRQPDEAARLALRPPRRGSTKATSPTTAGGPHSRRGTRPGLEGPVIERIEPSLDRV